MASPNSSNSQESLTLDSGVVAIGFEQDGSEAPVMGQIASLTSSNNFINFCLTAPNLPISNGQQLTNGSCNPAPMGIIPPIQNMPSCKFIFPVNNQVLLANHVFMISLAIQNFEAGNLVNPASNYMAAPQTLNSNGEIVGSVSFVIEELLALNQTMPTDPNLFALFQSISTPSAGGVVSLDVPEGLAPGFYRLSSMFKAANYQPVLVPVDQHGALNDMVYFTVTEAGDNPELPLPGSPSPTTSAPTISQTCQCVSENRHVDTPFLRNKAAVAGVFTGVACVIFVLVLLGVIFRRRFNLKSFRKQRNSTDSSGIIPFTVAPGHSSGGVNEDAGSRRLESKRFEWNLGLRGHHPQVVHIEAQTEPVNTVPVAASDSNQSPPSYRASISVRSERRRTLSLS